LLKYRFNNGLESNLFYWRDNTGHEIDVLLDFGTTVLPIEIKLGRTVASDFTKNILFYKKNNPACTKAVVIYGGDVSWHEHETYFISWRDLRLLEGLTWELKIDL